MIIELPLSPCENSPNDTLFRFAIWLLRHEVGSLELKVYLSLIFGYLGIFSVEESHQYVLATERSLVFA